MSAASGAAGNAAARPLEGIRCIEFGYGVAGPMLGRHLANFGADVLRIESRQHPDSLRQTGAGWIPLDLDITIRGDTGPMLNATSPGKRSIGLEVTGPRGREVVDALVQRSDVLISNMSVDALPHLELDYERVRRQRPDIVYVNATSFGSLDGPYRNYRTWGPNLTAITGVDQLVGWPDRTPAGIGISFPDFVVAYYAAVAAVAALLRRDITGEGACIEVSQYEAMVAGVGAEFLNYAVNGHIPGPNGNRDDLLVPQGVYPTRHPERWVAISVPDSHWVQACDALGLPEFVEDPRFATLDARHEHHDELDLLVAEQTSAQTAWEVAVDLQRLGVPAAPVFGPMDTAVDSHLASREFWHVLPHARFGRDLVIGHPVRLTGTPGGSGQASPALGEHTVEVLRELGFTDADVDGMVEDGTLYLMGESDVPLERPYWHWIGNVMRLPWPPSTLHPQALLMERLLSGHDSEEGVG